MTSILCLYRNKHLFVHAAVRQLSTPGPTIERETTEKTELRLHSLTVTTPDGKRILCRVLPSARRLPLLSNA